jgi:hypothetical protein
MVSRLLIYLEDDSTAYVDFNFALSDVQGFYRSDDDFHLCIIISGQIYELTYSQSLEQEIKEYIAFKDGLNNSLRN